MSKGVEYLTEHQSVSSVSDADPSVPALVTIQAAAAPWAPAVAIDGRALSYRDLEGRANRIARHLRTLGVGRESVVACCMERSTDLTVALLGVLKAGAAYLPLDPTYPSERLSFMLQDSESPVLLAMDMGR